MTASVHAAPRLGRWNGIVVIRLGHRAAISDPGSRSAAIVAARRLLVVAVSPADGDRARRARLKTSDRRRAGCGSGRAGPSDAGRLDRLGVVEERLVELLAGAQPDVLDRHRIRVTPGQPREVARQVDDADRLAHVEDEQVARLAEQRRLEDEPGRLGDGHEVAGHLGVRDRQRHALAELALEERHDAPR